MNTRQIKLQFAMTGAQTSGNFSQCSTSLADWIARNATDLSDEDMNLLMRLGGALYAAELEQNWQRSWS